MHPRTMLTSQIDAPFGGGEMTVQPGELPGHVEGKRPARPWMAVPVAARDLVLVHVVRLQQFLVQIPAKEVEHERLARGGRHMPEPARFLTPAIGHGENRSEERR